MAYQKTGSVFTAGFITASKGPKVQKITAALRFILKAMCADYNGLQVFFYPAVLAFWLNNEGLVQAFTSLIMVNIHYLPMVFYGVLFIYVGYMIMKVYTGIFDGPHHLYPERIDEFWELVIFLHLILFISLMVVMVFYVFSRFLDYFYGIEVHFKQGMMFAFKLFTMLLIIFYYVWKEWLKPILAHYGGNSFEARKYFNAFREAHPIASLKYTIIIIVEMFAAIGVYLWAVYNILYPLQELIEKHSGFRLYFILVPITSFGSVFYNLFMLASAFMLSNLLFYPIIAFFKAITRNYHPMKFISEDFSGSQTEEEAD